MDSLKRCPAASLWPEFGCTEAKHSHLVFLLAQRVFRADLERCDQSALDGSRQYVSAGYTEGAR